MGLQRISGGTGTKVKPSARTWNAMAAAAERSEAGLRGFTSDGLPINFLGERVTIQNTSGGDLPRGSIVELGNFLPDPTLDQLWFEAGTPTDAAEVHGILREPVADNGFGEAQLLGAVVALVNVNSTGHEYAYVNPTATELESAPIGPIRLLHVPGTGSQLCVVLLPAADEGVLTGELTADLDQGTSAAVDELDLDAGGAKVYTGRTFTVWDLKLNSGESIAQGTIIDFVRMSRGRYKWIAAHCDVSDTLPGA